uniref:NUC153 domain-containing protein n=1 Tax=Angiostrongylus cantonensis TaxID=6313 RepID=A0A0K0D2R8_ANGCA
MDDDEDVIVRKKKSRKIKTVLDSDDEEGSESELEFDVVVCNELPNTELYRLHFPDRKKDAFNFERHPRIRYKKNVKMMEMRLAPDISSGSFDKEKAERFAAMNLPNVKSENDIAPTKFDEIYEGRSYVRDDYVQFAVGYFRENTFFLSPIAGTFEMHMSLAHLNNATKVNREEDGEASGESDSESAKADAKQVVVAFCFYLKELKGIS